MPDNKPMPDYMEPLTGWRYWDVDHITGNLYSRSQLWPVREKKESEHSASSWKHECGGLENCICGIHAFKKKEYLQDYLDLGWSCYHYHAIGQVALWGKVVEHSRGYRAQFAYPKSIHLVYQCNGEASNSELGKLIAERYGIELTEDKSWTLEKSSENWSSSQYQIPYQNPPSTTGTWMGISRKFISSLPDEWTSRYLYNPFSYKDPFSLIKKPKKTKVYEQPSFNIHKPTNWWKDKSGLYLRTELIDD